MIYDLLLEKKVPDLIYEEMMKKQNQKILIQRQ